MRRIVLALLVSSAPFTASSALARPLDILEAVCFECYADYAEDFDVTSENCKAAAEDIQHCKERCKFVKNAEAVKDFEYLQLTCLAIGKDKPKLPILTQPPTRPGIVPITRPED